MHVQIASVRSELPHPANSNACSGKISGHLGEANLLSIWITICWFGYLPGDESNDMACLLSPLHHRDKWRSANGSTV